MWGNKQKAILFQGRVTYLSTLQCSGFGITAQHLLKTLETRQSARDQFAWNRYVFTHSCDRVHVSSERSALALTQAAIVSVDSTLILCENVLSTPFADRSLTIISKKSMIILFRDFEIPWLIYHESDNEHIVKLPEPRGKFAESRAKHDNQK